MSTARRDEAVLSRRQVEGMIADGSLIVILDKRVLKIDSWSKYHPGGERPLHHMVGKDATDEIKAMHSKETRAMMTRYQIGRIEGVWKNFVPPIQGGKYRTYLEGSKDSKKTESVELSRSPSPLFDTEPGVQTPDSSTSSSSETSAKENLGLAFLNAQTKQELDLDLAKYPDLDIVVQEEIILKYRLLQEQIEKEGLFNCNYTAYAWEAARCASIFSIMLLFYQHGWYATSAALTGIFWSQLVFSAHDAGHMGITHNYTIDTLIGMIIAAPLGGLSLGWWKATHNVHHIVTNAPEHDPDNQHVPFLAVNHRFLEGLFSTYHNRIMAYDAAAKFLVQYQAYTYYPLLAFGRFNLYVQSYSFLILGSGPRKGPAWWHRWFEISGCFIFWAWFGYGLVGHIPTTYQRIIFVLISHMINLMLHVQLTVSHFAMSTADLGPTESFPQKMLRTTMDVDCPPWLDWFHGGLQFQAIHHLFPRIPRHNLRKAQRLVKIFCADVGIPYALYGFVEGNRKVVGTLAEVARQAAVLKLCQRVVAERGDLLHEL